jgi:hypothetical protein
VWQGSVRRSLTPSPSEIAVLAVDMRVRPIDLFGGCGAMKLSFI